MQVPGLIKNQMARDFFDPTPEQQNVILIDAATLRKAERLIESCEYCNEEGAQIPFDYILDRITCSDPSLTDYILGAPAKCPNSTKGFVPPKSESQNFTGLNQYLKVANS